MTEILEKTLDRWGERCQRMIHTVEGPRPVEVFAEFHAEVIGGPMKGRSIECFAWIGRGDKGHHVSVTELKTGHKIAVMPILDDQRQPVNLDHISPDAMMQISHILTNAARHAAFEMFRDADDDQIVRIFGELDALVARYGKQMGVLYG